MSRKIVDLCGKTFGQLKVIKMDEEKSTTKFKYWICECSCGKIISIRGGNLKSGKSQSCGCSRRDDIIGEKFGRLLVLKMMYEENECSKCICECDCGNIITVKSDSLKTGNTNSCGCLKLETSATNGKNNKKYNMYNLTGEYGIGYTDKNEEFYFDLEDYDKIKYYCWYIHIGKRGYRSVISTENNKIIKFCNVVMNTNKQIDHKNRKPLDNRKKNLRICPQENNTKNKSLQCNNTSGIAGVGWHKATNKWAVRIHINNKEKHMGVFDSFDEAVLTRLKLELKYYGEFAPNKDLYIKYGLIKRKEEVLQS